MQLTCQSDISDKSIQLTLISNLKEITHSFSSYCHWYCWLRQNKNLEVILSRMTLYMIFSMSQGRLEMKKFIDIY
jgi:hypothetical protein